MSWSGSCAYGGRANGWAPALAVAVALAAGGCGGGQSEGAADGGRIDASTAGTSTAGTSTAGASAADAQDASTAEAGRQPSERADGTLVTADGKVIRDWGPKRDRKRLVARFVKLQRDFRAGRMKAVCGAVADLGLAQFTPGKTSFDTPCPAKLRAFAGELQRRGVAPATLRMLWVRSYALVASVWVEDPQGEPFRVGFTDVDGGGMKLELGTSSRRELLYGRLAGAGRYLSR
jgi:hypothetical protein